MAINFCESHLELAVLEWFEEIGYEIAFGPDIAPDGNYPERSDYANIILEERLKEALARINTSLPKDAL